ncbi:MAG: hypothetical protein LBG59_00570 [Candidatus Peribacteria bacterium]|jgi:hypothetical protein|nr:hypothetical protein [Candidatus Peribacteria bacterium]
MKLITGKDTKQILRIKPNPEAVKANASLDDKARILKAKELLKGKELTPEQEQAILEAHNQEGTIYNLTHEQIRSRVEILQNAGFTSGEIRVLFENGIVGKNNMEIKTEVKPLDIQSREVNNQIDSKTNPQEKSISDAQELKLLQEKYPYLLTRITNPETLSEIITTEVGKGNLILNVDGTVKEAFVEINGEKKSSQLFEKMKKDYDEEQALRTWLQVRTPEFKEWFGDWQGTDKAKVSRVVDENGEPLIVYH